MIRVLQILDHMDRGGIQTTLMNIFRNINSNDIVFDFLLQTNRECHYNDEIRKLGGKIFSVTPRRKSIIKNRKELRAFFKQHKEYKIVHMHVSSLTYIEPLVVAKKEKVPIRVIHSRNTRDGGGSKIHLLLHLINKMRIQSTANRYFCCSKMAGDWLFPRTIMDNNKYIQINNGIQVEKFKFDHNERKIIRRKLGCDGDIAMVNVGRLHRQKNQLFLIDIFKQFNRMHQNSKLYIIGEGGLESELNKKIADEKLDGKVILMGNIPNVHEILQGMDIFVMPSLYEGLPGSVIEAQGSSLPCLISSTITDEVVITDLVRQMELDKTPKEWAEVAYSLYKNNKRRDMCAQIRDAGFDMKEIADDLSKKYIRMLDESSC